MTWYAVRSFYRGQPVGRPKRRDAHYVPGLASVEERIVLFRARDADAAVKKARAEAERYASDAVTTNIYGQRVRVEPLPYLEAYEMDGEGCDPAAWT